MSFTNTVAGQLRIAIADLEQLTHSRTKESFAKVRASILKKLTQSADMLEGQFEIVPDDEAPKPAPKKRAPRARSEGNLITIDFKTRARADAESVFKK